MSISVRIKSVYGADVIYPVCDTAKAFAAIAGTKTLTRHALEIIQGMGYAVEIEAPTL